MFGLRQAAVLILLVFVPTPSIAQDTWKPPPFSTFEAMTNIWYPPQTSREVYQRGTDPKHQYKDDLRRSFEKDPRLGRFICAWGELGPPGGRPYGSFNPNIQQLKRDFTDVCRAFSPSEADRAAMRREYGLEDRPRPAPIAAKPDWEPPDFSTFDAMANIWYPRQASREVYEQSSDPKRRYKDDLRREFEKDPRLGRFICAWGELGPEGRSIESFEPNIQQLMREFAEVCRDFPPTEVDRLAMRKEYVSESTPPPPRTAQDDFKARAWLSGSMNALTDAAELMTSDQRRLEALRLGNEVAGSAMGSFSRFEKILRLIALRPDDTQGPFLALKHILESTYKRPPGLTVEITREFLISLYRSRSESGPNATAWRRGLRDYLIYSGDLASGRRIAEELTKQTSPNQSRDRIVLAVIDRGLGNEASYQTMMSQCPAADVEFVAVHGQPKFARQFCEMVSLDVASRALAVLDKSAPEAFREIYVESNRVTLPERMTRAAGSSPRVASAPEMPNATTREEGAFTAKLNAAVDRVEELSFDERRRRQQAILYGEEMIGLDETVQAIALRPQNDLAIHFALLHMPITTTSPEVDAQSSAQRKALLNVYEYRSRNGPRAEEWQEGLVGLLFYLGQFERAHELSQRLLKGTLREYSYRRVFDALLSRVRGNPAPLKALLLDCPPPHTSYLETQGQPAKRIDYCLNIISSIAHRGARQLKSKSPTALTEIMLEKIQRDPSHWPHRLDAIESIKFMNPGIAEQEWTKILNLPKSSVPTSVRLTTYRSLISLADERDDHGQASALLGRVLKESGYDFRGLAPDSWARLRRAPKYLPSEECDEMTCLLRDHVFELIYDNDFATARLVTEKLLVHELRAGRGSVVRHVLEKMADALIRSNQKTAAIRILGYLESHPLDPGLGERIEQMRKDLSSDEENPIRFPPQEKPWDSPVDPAASERPTKKI